MDPLASPAAGIGHNQPPEAVDPIAVLTARLADTHAALVSRFHELELACARVPEAIENPEEAAVATDFIAQCQAHIKTAEAVHRKEKEPFLKASRAVDAFFKRRCDRLTAALTPTVLRLKDYRHRLAEAERQRHRERQRADEEAAARAAAEAAQHRAEAARLARDAQTSEDRHQAAEHLRLAEEAAGIAEAAGHAAAAGLEPTRIRGDYGATAFVRRSWTFEVVDLDHVPREYMSLDIEVVRQSIVRDGVRAIPGLRIFQAETLQVRGAG